MPLKIAEYFVAEVVAQDTEAELAAFRAGWRMVRAQAKCLAQLAQAVVDFDGEPEFHDTVRTYREQYMHTWKHTQELMGLATKLSPEARAVVEAGVGPLFDSQGAITQWWRDLWLGPEVKEASRVRRLNDKSRI